MAIKTVVKMGQKSLFEISQKIEPAQFSTPELENLITDMVDTMHYYKGAGIAAPQIGQNQRVVIFGFESNPRYPDAPPIPLTVLINPVIYFLSTEKIDGWEGCLSVPGLRGLVPRYKKIRYTGYDQTGNIIDRTVEDFHARVIQHECDHLDGILFPMRISDMTKFGYEDVLEI